MTNHQLITKHFGTKMSQEQYIKLDNLLQDAKEQTCNELNIEVHQIDDLKMILPEGLKLIKWINFLFKALIVLMIIIAIASINKCHGQTLTQKGFGSHVVWDDDAKHFWAGAIIGGTTTHIVFKKTNRYGLAFFSGLLASSAIGAFKEIVFDGMMNKGVKSIQDGGMTSYGGLIGSGVTDLYHDFKERRRAEQIEASKHLMD